MSPAGSSVVSPTTAAETKGAMGTQRKEALLVVGRREDQERLLRGGDI